MPGFPVLHSLPEFAQTHTPCVSDAIQPSHPLLPPFPPALNLPQHQGLFQWVGCSHQVDKALELQHQSFQWIFKVDFLQDWLILSPCCLRDSQESSLPTIWKHQFFGPQPSLWSNSNICTWLLEKPLTIWTFVSKVMSLLFIFFNLFILIGGYLIYNIVVVLPYIDMNQPRVYMCSPTWTPLPPPSPSHPSGSSQCTSPELPVSCNEPGLAI